MIILPAIDLIDGKAVRLTQGDYAIVRTYSDDPVAVAKSFKACGAGWLHAVDLDGAKAGEPKNFATVEKIVAATGLKTEIGGGIRTESAIKRYLDAGVSRVILGTAAVRNRTFAEEMIAKYGEKIAVSLDAKNGAVMLDGWLAKSGEADGGEYLRLAGEFAAAGLKTLIYTDISRDGMLNGIDADAYKKLVRVTDGKTDIIASGGVTAVADVVNLRAAGATGAIVGKALYEGKITLPECLKAAKGGEKC